MESSERGAMMLVRVVAIALIGFGLAELVPAVAELMHASGLVAILFCVLKGLLALAGVIMLVKTRAIAEWLDDLLDG